LSALAAALAVAIAAGVLLELAARAWLARRGGYYVWAPFTRLRMELDRESLPGLEPETRFEVNAEGERGDPLPGERRGLYRVLVAGGSAAECYFLDQASAWPGVLQGLLNEPAALSRLDAERVHVGNIARSLAPCEAIHLVLRRVLPRYERLDLVLLMVGMSDVVNWLEQRTPPALAEGRIDLATTFAEQPEGPFGWTTERLALRRVASRLWRRLHRPVQVRRRAGQRFVRLRRMRQQARELIDEVPDPAPLLAHFEKHLRRVVEEARSHGARVVVVRQPWFCKEFSPEEQARLWNFAVGRPYREETTSYYTHRIVWDLARRVDARAAAIARELAVEELDLMPHLEPSFANFYDELHFTPRGARVVAEVIARHLLAKPHVDSG